MAKKNTSTETQPTQPADVASGTPAKARKPRTPRVLSEAETLAKSEFDASKARLKESKAVAKVVGAIGKLSPWGLDQAESAMQKRDEELKEPKLAE